MVKVINFVPGLGSGGIGMLMKEWYKRKEDDIVFDIATIGGNGIAYSDLLAQGCNIFQFEPITKVGPIRYTKNIYKIIVDGDYDIVHSHVGMISFFVFIAAILAKKKNRFLHAHGTKYNKDNGKLVNSVISNILKKLSVICATHYLACSTEAAVYLFGKKIASEKAIIIKNGIDLSKFTYMKKEEKEKKIIGYIARFDDNKNQVFLLRVLKKLIERGRNVELYLIGDGDIEKIKQVASEEKVENYLHILPPQKNVEKYYHLMDIFVFPSLHEGLGIVAIEAQACGTPTILSPGIPSEAIISNDIARCVDLDSDLWANEIEYLLDHPINLNIHNAIINNGYDIISSTKHLMSIYCGVKNNGKKS